LKTRAKETWQGESLSGVVRLETLSQTSLEFKAGSLEAAFAGGKAAIAVVAPIQANIRGVDASVQACLDPVEPSICVNPLEDDRNARDQSACEGA
jgi:hypothetical protein